MLNTGDVVIRLGLAALAGAVLGWERSSKQKPAGLRTHMLVTIGAAAFILAGLEFEESQTQRGTASNADFHKVIAGVIGGVGFLGAGAIMQSGGSVRGLTTAATIWLSSAIGVACGLGYYVIAATTVILSLCVLLMLGFVERVWLPDKDDEDAAAMNPAKSEPPS